MTPKRAHQIAKEIRNGGSKTVTSEENTEIMTKWATMDGQSCYYNAVERIAKGN